MKIRFNKKQWDNFLFIYAYLKYRYNTVLEPVVYMSMFGKYHEAHA